jgi:hypothetical protein
MPAPEEQVILDSVPVGAKIVRDGQPLGETPDSVRVPHGSTVTLVLRKEGYLEQSVVVDPANGHKLLVRLERPKPPPHAPAPAKPPAHASVAAPATPPEPTTRSEPAPAPAPRLHPAPPSDPVSAAVERQAAAAAPGARRVGNLLEGQTFQSNGHSDWYVSLDAGRCYTFVGVGGPGVSALYLYLWGPNGKRLTDRRAPSPGAVMPFCTSMPGMYHVQAKVARGGGQYRVGVYAP